ncbi:hypothetical protein [Nonomuraea sp. KM90]|uniref:hypothetical protein n=1 Tax=Nonomuraea sp. KM90 TaxID=3457428 RepID=UPI003FCC5A8E
MTTSPQPAYRPVERSTNAAANEISACQSGNANVRGSVQLVFRLLELTLPPAEPCQVVRDDSIPNGLFHDPYQDRQRVLDRRATVTSTDVVYESIFE